MTPEGKYVADITGAVSTESKNGSPQICISMNVTEFVDPATGTETLPVPIERRMYLSYHGGAVEYTDKKLKALGFDGNFENIGFSTNRVEVLCKHGTKQDGTAREEWDLANWGDAQEVKPASKATIQKMAALWRAKQGKTTPQSSGVAGVAGKPPAKPVAGRSTPKPAAGPVATRDEAWASLCAAHDGKPDDVVNDLWAKLLGDAETRYGVAESAFTGQQWHAIKETASLPF